MQVNGFHIQLSSGGGKAGKGNNKTASVQVRQPVNGGYLIRKIFRYKVRDRSSLTEARAKASLWAANNSIKKTLSRTKQCQTCPWKKDADPYQIPNYNLELHKGLSKTIAKDLSYTGNHHVMSCHYSTEKIKEYCIGWLDNQLGAGNNIMMRLEIRNYDNADQIEVFGDQHESFEDTLPVDKKS